MTATDAGYAPARTPTPFKPFHKWDRNFFAIMVAAIWIGVATGFGLDSLRHFQSGEAAYPVIVHFHAVAYVGWLVLLATQLLLIRNGRADIHRRLGLFAIGLAVFMVVIGPIASVIVEIERFGTPKSNPRFLAVPFVAVTAFAALTAAAITLRKDAAAHKRLILLATLSISSAGFVRWLRYIILPLMGHTTTAFFWSVFLGPDVLILAMVGYDLATRHKLHPAFAAGVAWSALTQVLTICLYISPWWQAVTTGWVSH